MGNANAWRRSGAFIVNFEHFTPCSSVSIVNFEHAIAGWVVYEQMQATPLLKIGHKLNVHRTFPRRRGRLLNV